MKINLSIDDDAELRTWIKSLVRSHIESLNKEDIKPIVNAMLDAKIKQFEKELKTIVEVEIKKYVTELFVKDMAHKAIKEVVTEALTPKLAELILK